MKLLSVIVALVVMIAGCIGKPAAAPTPQPIASSALAESLEQKTVAIVAMPGHEDDGSDPYDDMGFRAICSGVWVSHTMIVTASHCVKGEQVGFVTHDDMYGKEQRRTPRVATLYTISKDHDLAILMTDQAPKKHAVATMRKGDVKTGLHVHTMGHPLGMWYSYSSGEVASVTKKHLLDKNLTFVQSTAPMSPGNSGGGLWDDNGDLIGIACVQARIGQNVNFFVHSTYIDEIVGREQRSLRSAKSK